MTAPPQGGPLHPAVALAFATIGYFTLLIFGLGMVSLATESDVVATPGVAPAAGVTAALASGAVFAGLLWQAVRRPHPSYWASSWITVATFLAYLVGMAAGALMSGSSPTVALSLAGRIATTWFGVVVAGSGFVSAWAGVALVRTRAQRPRWPWEEDE